MYLSIVGVGRHIRSLTRGRQDHCPFHILERRPLYPFFAASTTREMTLLPCDQPKATNDGRFPDRLAELCFIGVDATLTQCEATDSLDGQ